MASKDLDFTHSKGEVSTDNKCDISERKKAEETIAFQANLLSNVHDAIVAVDKNFVITYWNKMAEEMFGWTANEAIGQPSKQLFDVKLDGLSQEEVAEKLLKNGYYRGEASYRRKDGTCTLSDVRSKVLRGQNGEIKGIVTSVHDMTEHKQMEAKLEGYAKNLEKLVEERSVKIVESEESYRELYESFDEAFIATDWEFNVIHWNKAAERVTTVTAKDALGKKIYEVLPEMNLVEVEPYFEALQARKPARFMMNVVSRQTGKPSIFEISTYPSKQGIIIIVEDKTEEEQTKRLSAIGATAGMVGHDIRNPLQAITSDVYLAKADLASCPESIDKKNLLESLDEIAKNVEYINKIVADLQDYGRQLKPVVKEIDLGNIIKDLLQKTPVAGNIMVSFDVEGTAEKVLADPDFLKRILGNLVSNALQAMLEGGNLNVRAYKEKNDLVLTVKDTGVGIPDEAKDKMFTPLFTTKSKGQGFGLAVVKRMTEALSGTVSFESEKGKGTTFTVRLPQRINGK